MTKNKYKFRLNEYRNIYIINVFITNCVGENASL